MAAMSVKDAAARVGVSERRVRAMLEGGKLAGRKVGGRWLVELDAEASVRGKLPIKPLSKRSSWALMISVGLAAGQDGRPSDPVEINLEPVERYRLKARLDRLANAEDPVPLLRSWLPNRAARYRFHVNPVDLADLRSDERIALSGVSHAASGLLAGNEVEAYVRADDAGGIKDDYLLVEPRPDSPANVVLHVVDEGDPIGQKHGLPWLALAADLAERSGVREEEAARNLVRRALADSAP